jgi:hypothetical protein
MSGAAAATSNQTEATSWQVTFSCPLIVRGVAVGDTQDAAMEAVRKLLVRLGAVADSDGLMKSLHLLPGSMHWQQAGPPTISSSTSSHSSNSSNSSQMQVDSAGPSSVSAGGLQLVQLRLLHLMKRMKKFMARRSRSRNAAHNVISAVRTTLRGLQPEDPDTLSLGVVLDTLRTAEQGPFTIAVRTYNNARLLLSFVEFCKGNSLASPTVLEAVRAKAQQAATSLK